MPLERSDIIFLLRHRSGPEARSGAESLSPQKRVAPYLFCLRQREDQKTVTVRGGSGGVTPVSQGLCAGSVDTAPRIDDDRYTFWEVVIVLSVLRTFLRTVTIADDCDFMELLK